MLARFARVATALALTAGAAGAAPFTIVAIPDTQVNSVNPAWSTGFSDMTEWIAANVGEHNIVFVTHLGDVVQGEFPGELDCSYGDGACSFEELPAGSFEEQWQRADAAMAMLDGVVPYSVIPGNHDFEVRGRKESSADLFRTYFGPDRYAGLPWYGGSRVDAEHPNGSRLSHYQIFEAGGFQYLHIAIEYKPHQNGAGAATTAVWEWAQTILDTHPTLPAIVTSHEYLTDVEGDGTGSEGGRSGTGELIWENFVRTNPQVFMTLNGHEHEGPERADGEYHQVSLNDEGLPVFEMLSNYQDWYHPLWGNEPYVRLITFDVEGGRIDVRTFSPSIDKLYGGTVLPDSGPRDDALAATGVLGMDTIGHAPWQTDADSQFAFDVLFDENGRPFFAPAP